MAGLPEHGADGLKVQRAEAEKQSTSRGTDTMAGPHGIPYAALRALGLMVVDVLFDAADAPATEQGIQYLQDACDDNGAQNHKFNMGHRLPP